MKRQNSQLSSTSRRDNSPETLRAKTIGCMSGIIHLLSKYQNRHKKSLTFGKTKHEKDIIVVSSPSDQIVVPATGMSRASPPSRGPRKSRNEKEGKCADADLRRFSCDLPTRSPTLSAEIRRSNSVNSPASSGAPPALIARLMGLEAVPAVSPSPPADTSSEKRRKLLGALEKCNNDLKSVKEMIVALRSAESPQSAAPIAGNLLTEDKVGLISGGKFRADYNCGEQQLSPVSVLNEFSRLRLNRISCTSKGPENGEERRGQQAQEVRIRKKAAVEKEELWKLQSKEPLRSKAMMESLNEICNQISWNYTREMATIGISLHHHIYIDLLEDMLSDIIPCFPIVTTSSLPLQACRRRLPF